jgi:hypothetical protein
MSLLPGVRAALPTLMALGLAAACEGEQAAVPTTSGFSSTAAAHGDPGLPASYYGPKCSFAHSGGKAPECLSAVLTEVPGGVHLFLNFCVRNQMMVCPAGPEAYLSLLLPMTRWEAAAQVTEAIGGRAWIQLPDGRVHEARADATRPLPIDLQITEHPVTGGGLSYRGVLRMTLPRIDAAGDPLQITAQVP